MVYILNLYSWIIVVNTVLTLFTRPKDKDNDVKILFRKLTDPVNNIFRKFLRSLGWYGRPVDVSPMLSLIAIWIAMMMLQELSRLFAGLP